MHSPHPGGGFIVASAEPGTALKQLYVASSRKQDLAKTSVKATQAVSTHSSLSLSQVLSRGMKISSHRRLV